MGFFSSLVGFTWDAFWSPFSVFLDLFADPNSQNQQKQQPKQKKTIKKPKQTKDKNKSPKDKSDKRIPPHDSDKITAPEKDMIAGKDSIQALIDALHLKKGENELVNAYGQKVKLPKVYKQGETIAGKGDGPAYEEYLKNRQERRQFIADLMSGTYSVKSSKSPERFSIQMNKRQLKVSDTPLIPDKIEKPSANAVKLFGKEATEKYKADLKYVQELYGDNTITESFNRTEYEKTHKLPNITHPIKLTPCKLNPQTAQTTELPDKEQIKQNPAPKNIKNAVKKENVTDINAPYSPEVPGGKAAKNMEDMVKEVKDDPIFQQSLSEAGPGANPSDVYRNYEIYKEMHDKGLNKYVEDLMTDTKPDSPEYDFYAKVHDGIALTNKAANNEIDMTKPENQQNVKEAAAAVFLFSASQAPDATEVRNHLISHTATDITELAGSTQMNDLVGPHCEKIKQFTQRSPYVLKAEYRRATEKVHEQKKALKEERAAQRSAEKAKEKEKKKELSNDKIM